ncbi:hypothetical protein ACKI2N_018960 [Cupriavidus sp. 30B13]|uniref:hypothetical protein n=1 Tax=Cupriavidus sp. 30B13 TaxID=3384241 RepID=UPI003B8F7C89
MHWQVLQLAPTTDTRRIRSAYAARLKVTRPDDDAEAFQALRAAYEFALEWARHHAQDDAAGSPDAAGTPEAAAGTPPPGAPQAEATPPSPLVTAASPVRGSLPAIGPLPLPLPAPPPAQPSPSLPSRSPASPVPFTSPVPPAAALPDPAALAQAMWARLAASFPPPPAASAGSHAGPDRGELAAQSLPVAEALQRCLQDDAFVSIEARAQFEWLALCYCARDDASPAARTALFEGFGWEEQAAHLARRDGALTRHAVARALADRQFSYFRTYAKGSAAARALLAPPPARIGWRALMGGGFVRDMRALLEQLRWKTPETRHFHFDDGVLAAWEDAVSRPLLSWGQLFHALWIGAIAASVALMIVVMHEERAGRGAVSPWLALGTCGAVLAAPMLLWIWYVRFWQQAVMQRLARWRARPGVQWSWFGLYAVIGAFAMFAGSLPSLYGWFIGAELYALLLAFALLYLPALQRIGVGGALTIGGMYVVLAVALFAPFAHALAFPLGLLLACANLSLVLPTRAWLRQRHRARLLQGQCAALAAGAALLAVQMQWDLSAEPWLAVAAWLWLNAAVFGADPILDGRLKGWWLALLLVLCGLAGALPVHAETTPLFRAEAVACVYLLLACLFAWSDRRGAGGSLRSGRRP